MKKSLFCLMLAALMFAACKKDSGTTESKTLKQTIEVKNIVKTAFPDAPGGSEGCETCTTNDPPSQYTGYDASTISSIVASGGTGYHIYSNVAYDTGWKDGYEDAMWWVSYYSSGVCNIYMKVKVGHIDGSPDTTVPYGTTLGPGEIALYLLSNWSCNGNLSWPEIKCRVRNNCGPMGLRLQYYYNTTYSGVSADQHSYDMGRYTAFDTYTSHEPLSVAPGP